MLYNKQENDSGSEEEYDTSRKERKEKLKRNKTGRRGRKGNWTTKEDNTLNELILKYQPKKWSFIASKMDTQRTGKQCRERWFNHLDPSIKTEWWTPDEEKIIIEAHEDHGNSWAKISKLLVGRPANNIKNHFNATLRRHVEEKKKELSRDAKGNGSKWVSCNLKLPAYEKENGSSSSDKSFVTITVKLFVNFERNDKTKKKRRSKKRQRDEHTDCSSSSLMNESFKEGNLEEDLDYHPKIVMTRARKKRLREIETPHLLEITQDTKTPTQSPSSSKTINSHIEPLDKISFELGCLSEENDDDESDIELYANESLLELEEFGFSSIERMIGKINRKHVPKAFKHSVLKNVENISDPKNKNSTQGMDSILQPKTKRRKFK